MAEGLFERRIREKSTSTKAFYRYPETRRFVQLDELYKIVEEAKAEWPLNPDYAWALKKYVEQVEAKAKELGGQPKIHEEKSILRLYDWFVRWFVNGEVKEK